MAGLRDWATLYLKGVAMGSADAVPGVSGGTIALIVGIYERLIAAVTAIDPDRIRRVLAGVRPANIPDARAAFHEADGAFLLVLGAGIGTAVIVVLSGVNYLLATRPVATYGFFFGLIAASAAVLLGGVALGTLLLTGRSPGSAQSVGAVGPSTALAAAAGTHNRTLQSAIDLIYYFKKVRRRLKLNALLKFCIVRNLFGGHEEHAYNVALCVKPLQNAKPLNLCVFNSVAFFFSGWCAPRRGQGPVG
jgi:uncharacterized membrane protein